MALPKDIQDAVAAVAGKVGQPVDDPKLFGQLQDILAKMKARAELGRSIGLASRADTRSYYRKLARESALAVNVPNTKKAPIKFGAVGDASSQAAGAAGEGIKAAFDETADALRKAGIDLPAELDRVLEVGAQLSVCATAIAAGASQGAAVGAAVTSAPCVSTGIGCVITGAGVEIGTIVGVVVAAWQCGLFDLAIEGLVFLVDTMGDFLADIFDPAPDNFSWYVDVGGPTLRPTGWSPSSEYDRRFFGAALGPLPPAARAQAEKALTTRIAGSKLNGYLGVWLVRRTRELGGGAEEWARVSDILGVERGPQKKDATLYDQLAAAIEKLDAQSRALMKPVLVGALIAGGFNGLEAQEKVYGKKPKSAAQVQARIELAVLREMLAALEPGPKERDERKAINRKLLELGVRLPTGRKSQLGPLVGAVALLGASFALASPIPLAIGAGAYLLSKRKKPAASPEKMTRDEAVAQIKASGEDPFKAAWK